MILPSILPPFIILLLTGYWYIALFVPVGYFLFRFGIEPDLDLVGISSSEADWIKSVVGIPLVAWSTLYARCVQAFGGHRSWASHFPIISTFIRLMWFGFPFVLVFRYFWLDPLHREFLGLFIGLSIADFWHILADWLSGDKNKPKKGNRDESILNRFFATVRRRITP